MVLNFEFTEDIPTTIQQRGRVFQDGYDTLFVVNTDIASYLSLVCRSGNSTPFAATCDDSIASFSNTEISSTKKTQAATTKERLEIKYLLSKVQARLEQVESQVNQQLSICPDLLLIVAWVSAHPT